MEESNLRILEAVQNGEECSDTDALHLAAATDLISLLDTASRLRDQGHGNLISYSRKVFIPLTQLCRDVCHYCTFAQAPRPGQRAYLRPDEVLAIARSGAAAGCNEALFTLGDKPERRYKVAREELAALGHDTTVGYLTETAELVLRETGLLPHANPGVVTRDELAALRRVAVSQGIMLESLSQRLCQPGGVHYGSPDKRPAARMETIRLAGEVHVPFTSGILIGIGETRRERVESLLALRDLHRQYGHLQEIIIQNFRAKEATRMAGAPEPDFDDLRWTLAIARIIFGPDMNIQAPPNLSPRIYGELLAAGLNDWGGVSPVTSDHVNPEAPWPQLDALARITAEHGFHLVERLAIYPTYALQPEVWLDPAIAPAVVRAQDMSGFARNDSWSPGVSDTIPSEYRRPAPAPINPPVRRPGAGALGRILDRALAGNDLSEEQIVHLFAVRGSEFDEVCAAADQLRRDVNGETVTYVVNRNIQYTNICYFRCQFCAFSKGKLAENLRGQPYLLPIDEIVRRAKEAWDRGATEVCMQGGIHPDYTGETYLAICRAVHDAVPQLHLHAFSPLEVWQGASTLGLPLRDFLARLRDAGLGTLPGTAAEILDDSVRRLICPDKITTSQWQQVMEEAHRLGFRTTSTIMYGHLERSVSWARHLLVLRSLQQRTGGFTEFVPLPFVPMEAPMYLKGKARRGPTFREAILMHAVARLALHPLIPNIQVSWVKMGLEGARICLRAGANDLGGTLMNESISRSAGGTHGQELPPSAMEELIASIGRVPRQRSTTYGGVGEARRAASFQAAPLTPLLQPVARRFSQRLTSTLEARPVD